LDLDHLRVDVDRDLKLATITFDLSEKMNRISMNARDQVRELLERFDADPGVTAIALTGAGDKAFSAGGDIPGFMDRTPEQLSDLHFNVAAPERCSKPVISAVDGYCFGVGLEFTLACDFILATRRSRFALPEITIGMIPGSGGSQRLLKFLGPYRTKWMVMRGEHIPAEQAYEWGFVSKLVEDGALDDAVAELVEELNRLSPVALRTLKRVLNLGMDAPLSAGLATEGFAYGMMRSTDDFKEGVDAFTAKRKPEFKGS
jgi:2-oxoglutaroyl-CoA hydrolase